MEFILTGSRPYKDKLRTTRTGLAPAPAFLGLLPSFLLQGLVVGLAQAQDLRL